MPLIHRQVFYVCGIVPQYCVYCFRLSGNCFFNYLKRYQLLVPYISISPILFVTASVQDFSCGLSNSCNARTACRLLHRDSRQSNTVVRLPDATSAILIMLSPIVHCQLSLLFQTQEIQSACPVFQSSCP